MVMASSNVFFGAWIFSAAEVDPELEVFVLRRYMDFIGCEGVGRVDFGRENGSVAFEVFCDGKVIFSGKFTEDDDLLFDAEIVSAESPTQVFPDANILFLVSTYCKFVDAPAGRLMASGIKELMRVPLSLTDDAVIDFSAFPEIKIEYGDDQFVVAAEDLNDLEFSFLPPMMRQFLLF